MFQMYHEQCVRRKSQVLPPLYQREETENTIGRNLWPGEDKIVLCTLAGAPGSGKSLMLDHLAEPDRLLKILNYGPNWISWAAKNVNAESPLHLLPISISFNGLMQAEENKQKQGNIIQELVARVLFR